MSQESVEIVRRWLDLWRGRDQITLMADADRWQAVLDALDPSVEVRWSAEIPDAHTHRGHEGMERASAEWLGAWEEFRMDPIEMIDAGDQAVVRFRQRGRGKGSGVEVEMEVTQVYDVRDGKITRIREYTAKEEAFDAAGLGR